jgi:hypothetical protein
MTGYAINAKSKALELHELSSEELDSVSGGGIKGALEGVCSKDEVMGGGGPMGMFNQIMQQVQQMQPR